MANIAYIDLPAATKLGLRLKGNILVPELQLIPKAAAFAICGCMITCTVTITNADAEKLGFNVLTCLYVAITVLTLLHMYRNYIKQECPA